MLPLLALLALVGCRTAAASPVYRVQAPLAVRGSTAGITPPRLTVVDTHEVPEDGRISVYVRVRNDTPDVAYTPGARVAYAGSDGATLAADAERGAFRTLPPG